MTLIDSHCHLYSAEFDADLPQVLARAEAAGVVAFYLPAIDSATHGKMLDMCAVNAACRPMMGLHPCSVKENYRAELDIVEELLATHRFAAIGETGLDLYWDKTFAGEQKTALDAQIKLALRYDLPIVLHTRNATHETVKAVKPYVDQGLTGIFHCFSGSAEEAKEITDMGFALGIGGVVTYKNTVLPHILQRVGLGRIVLETDAPYLSPVPYRGKRNESSHLAEVVKKLAEIFRASPSEIAEATTANAQNIFKW